MSYENVGNGHFTQMTNKQLVGVGQDNGQPGPAAVRRPPPRLDATRWAEEILAEIDRQWPHEVA